MKQEIEILKIAKIYFSHVTRGYETETEILGVFSEPQEVYRALKKLEVTSADFDYLHLDEGDDTVVIFWETYDLNEIAPSSIWDEFCEEKMDE